MRPLLTPSQGRVIAALALSLSDDGGAAPRLRVEAATVEPWSSLTFGGERHRLTLRLPPDAVQRDLLAAAIDFPGGMIAIEAAVWASDGDAALVDIALLAIDA